MTRSVFEKLCTKKVCVDFLAPGFSPRISDFPKLSVTALFWWAKGSRPSGLLRIHYTGQKEGHDKLIYETRELRVLCATFFSPKSSRGLIG